MNNYIYFGFISLKHICDLFKYFHFDSLIERIFFPVLGQFILNTSQTH